MTRRSDNHHGFAPHPDAPPHLQPRYDPYNFKDTGPDADALRLVRQGAPGAPQPVGTCRVAIKVVVDPAGKYALMAMSQQCKKHGKIHRGGKYADMLVLAERDAARMDGHQCTNERW